jgi:hypothetical protein
LPQTGKILGIRFVSLNQENAKFALREPSWQRCSIRRSKTAIAFIALSVLIAPAVGGCQPQRTVGRVEALYKSMGGPEFVGTDGGTDQNIVNKWFEADISRSDKFTMKGGICNGYQPAREVAPTENAICAGAARVSMNRLRQLHPDAP